MGKATLLLVVLGAGLLAMRQFSDVGASVSSSESRATEDAYQILARSNALAGFTRLEQALSTSFASATLSGTFEGGTYTATADVVGAEATITTKGLYARPNGDETRVQIRALVAQAGGGIPEENPPFLQHSLLAGGNLGLSGSADIVRRESQFDTTSFNPLIHTNATLDVSGGATRVFGFGSYTGSATGSYESAFIPPYNPDGLPSTQPADAVEIPPFDPDAVADAYTNVQHFYPITPGQPVIQEVRTTLPGGTREDPIVYYAHGDVTLNSVHVDGYAIFVVEGDVVLSGTNTSSAPTAGETESTMSIYSGGTIGLTGNTSVQAQLISEAGLTYAGTIDIYGSLITRSSLNLTGAAMIHALPNSPALAKAWAEGTAGLVVLAYTEY